MSNTNYTSVYNIFLFFCIFVYVMFLVLVGKVLTCVLHTHSNIGYYTIKFIYVVNLIVNNKMLYAIYNCSAYVLCSKSSNSVRCRFCMRYVTTVTASPAGIAENRNAVARVAPFLSKTQTISTKKT